MTIRPNNKPWGQGKPIGELSFRKGQGKGNCGANHHVKPNRFPEPTGNSPARGPNFLAVLYIFLIANVKYVSKKLKKKMTTKSY